ncbi:WD40 repeat domain-containing protein [Oxynema sp. CENA135]|uniref:WD40 repeat domain-containing protein n=1 Tax=Oxynema sp. CENA135 TaxID=984206 RepID=UPI00190945BA|nr:WD40 repeat domain-containing protein [Oxynema sp. CENA135]MBK4730196.1 WD40 repeat domain-containing protein [Oxynema sp. CENA135]
MSRDSFQLTRTLYDRSGPVAAVAFSPDGEMLAIGSCDSALKIWGAKTGDRLHTLFGYPLGVTCLAIGPQSDLLAVGAPDGTIDLWHLPDGHLLEKFSVRGRVTAVLFSPSGKRLIVGSDRTLVDTLFSAPGGTACDDGFSGDEGGTIQIWNLQTHKLQQAIATPNAPVEAIAAGHCTSVFASAHRDGTIKLWKFIDGSQCGSLRTGEDPVYSLAIAPDGSLLATGNSQGQIAIWAIAESANLQDLPLRILEGHREMVYCVAISPDGHLLASGSGDSTVRLWEIDRGELLQVLHADSNDAQAILTLAFSPDSSTLVAGMDRGGLQMWQIGNLVA